MLAQSSPEIGTWVLVAVLIVNGLGGVGGLIAIFATRREVDAIDRRLASIEDTQRADTGQLHEKVNGVDHKVAGLMAKTDLQNQQLQRIENNVQRLAERKP